jgi:large subunit ribosomal protein L1
MESRHQHRLERWAKYKDKRVEQRVEYLSKHGKPGSPSPEIVRSDASAQPYRRMDETVELALQLNLDPRKPGQSLRGSLSLPHGNGKNFAVAVFTEDAKLAELAMQTGAVAAGGASLIESIRDGKTPISSFQRTLASPEVVSQLSSIARLLGPRGLMPTPKLNTIVPHEQLIDALAKQMSGTSNYRTDKDGIIRLGIGKGSFGPDKLLDNIREMMNEVHSLKPETFGKGKKGQKKVAKGAKYYLKAHLSATQSSGSFLVDLRTIDPTSPFFMIEPQ